MDISLWKSRKKELHYTLDDIAEKSGLSRKTIVNFFSNKTDPRKETVEAISSVLGIKTDADEWTDEEKSQGVGRHPTYLSAEDWEWQEIKSEIIRIQGEEYYKILVATLKALTK